MAGNRRNTCLVAMLLLGPALVLAWMLIQGPVITYLRESQLPAPMADLLRPTTPEANDEPRDAMAFLPPGAVLFDTLQADLDGDGQKESLVAFNLTDEAGGLLVVDTQIGREPQIWTVQPRTEGEVVDLELVDVNADHDLEVLLHEALEGEKWHYLHIYDWDKTGLVGLNPHGGPLDSMDGFQSACLPPEFKDVNMDGALELLVYQEQPGYGRLSVLVYTWADGNFVYEDANYVVGPRRPAHCTEGLQ